MRRIRKLTVTEHHGKGEVVRIDIGVTPKVSVVIQHLASQKSIIVELVEDDDRFARQRVGHFHYD